MMAHLWPKSLETHMLENQKCERPFLKKNMLSIWALTVCGRGVNFRLDGLGQTFLQSKFLTFGVPKCLPGLWQKGSQSAGSPARWGYSLEEWCKFSRLHFSATLEIVQPGWCINHQQKDEKYSARENCKQIFIKLCTPRQHKQEDIFNFERWFLVRTRKILLLKGFPIGIEKSSYWDTGLQFWEIKDVWRRERIWSAQTQFKIDIFPGKWTTQESLLITLARVGGKYLGWGGTANKDEGSGALAGSSATQSWPLHSFYCQAYWILNGHQCHIDWTYNVHIYSVCDKETTCPFGRTIEHL